MDATLPVHIYGVYVGDIRRISRDQITYQSTSEGMAKFGIGSTIVSLSLPLGPRQSLPGAATAFFGGLLPEGKGLENLVRDSGAERPDVLGHLAYAGLDVAGALQIGEISDLSVGSYEPMTDAQVAQKIGRINLHTLGQVGGGGSLAGYQPKMTMARIDGAWHDAVNGAPSTHIVKPCVDEDSARGLRALFDEAYCLELGRRCDLVNFASEVSIFDGTSALVIERYDRFTDDQGVIGRVHQEDLAQAIGLPWDADSKFEHNHPYRATLKNMAGILSRRRTAFGQGLDDREQLLAYVVANVVCGNTDAHGKNFSILHRPDGRIELAPLYDVTPQILYYGRPVTLSMKIDGISHQPHVTRERLISEAASWGLKENRALEIVNETLEKLRYASQEIELRGGSEKLPLLVAGHAKNLLNGRKAAIASGPIALSNLAPISKLPPVREP
ncbi:HipA domain-containing protein [Glutamicibacter ardleyensis]|uniref:HipA domain-containing protein n=1 Tax=Glutamicibacter ardleyensis TaxID=225894 RepID=UPI003FCF20D7